MKIKEVIEYLDELAPRHYQESYDNAGLIIGDEDREITGLITCLDSTEAIIDEAISKNCNLIVAHHPLIFSGVKTITGDDYVSKAIIKAIKNNIAIFAIHTNLDNMLHNGVNTRICDRLELINRTALVPKEPVPGDTRAIGTGIVAELEQPMDALAFLKYLSEKMKTNFIKYTQLPNKPIKKIAVCGGSGAFLLQHAIATGADVYLSGDFKYHDYFDANNKIVIADIGHYESEIFTIDLLLELIQKKFSTFAAYCTTLDTNPVKYFI